MNTLRTDYVDAVTDEQRYKLTDVGNGEYLIEDVSDYSQEGSYFGAGQHNETNRAVNELIQSVENSEDTIQKIISGTLPQNNIVSLTADNSQTMRTFETARKINNVEFDGTGNITVEDSTKVSKNKSFVLISKEELTFSSKVCSIYDERITSDSLAEVIFTDVDVARASVPSVETTNGAVTITLGRNPSETLYASIYIRRP